MVNSGNFFGARGRAADPMSDRQLAMRCKERGLVFDRETKSCRESRRGAGLDRAREARRQKRGDGPTMAQLRAECKARGLTLDVDTKSCRESRRGAGLDRAREARREKRGGAMTIAQLRAECKARGLVLDKDTKSCRAASRRLSGLEAAYKRGSLFFGMTNGYVGGNKTHATIAGGVSKGVYSLDPMLTMGGAQIGGTWKDGSVKYGLSSIATNKNNLTGGGMSRQDAMALKPTQQKITKNMKPKYAALVAGADGIGQAGASTKADTQRASKQQAANNAAINAAYLGLYNANVKLGMKPSAAAEAAVDAMTAGSSTYNSRAYKNNMYYQ